MHENNENNVIYNARRTPAGRCRGCCGIKYLHKGGDGGGPQLAAVVLVAVGLQVAGVVAVRVAQQQAVALFIEGRAGLHPAFAVRRLGIVVAAARMLCHRRLARTQRLVPAEHTARRAVALALALFEVAFCVALGRVALVPASGLLDRCGRGRGHWSVRTRSGPRHRPARSS